MFEVTWRKKWRRTSKRIGRLQKRRSMRNILQPTRSLYHFRFMAHYVIFTDIFNVTWLKNLMSYVKTERQSQKQNSIRNVLQPTRSICHFRFKSYGPLSDFHKSGDLDLALHPIFHFFLPRSLELKTSAVKKSWRSDQRCGLYTLPVFEIRHWIVAC